MPFLKFEQAPNHEFSNEKKLKEFLENLITAIEKRMQITLDNNTRENIAAIFAKELINFNPDAPNRQITGKFLLEPQFNFIPSLVFAMTANHLADNGKTSVIANDFNENIVSEFKQSATSSPPTLTLSLIGKLPEAKTEEDIALLFNGLDCVRDNVFNKNGSLNMAVFNNLISIASMFEELGLYADLTPTPKPH